MPEIYVDADACPVKPEILKVAERHDLPVTFVANSGLRPSRDPMVEQVVVDAGPDIADDWIAERAGPGDIVITADIPLADRCLKAGAQALKANGQPFTEASIGMALAMRDLMRELRETGDAKGGGPPFSRADRSRFLQALEDAIQAIRRARKA